MTRPLPVNSQPGRPGRCPLATIATWMAVCGAALAAQGDGPPKPTRVALIRFEGMIQPLREQYFYRKVDKARAAEADLVIVEINSPGGYVDSSLNLAQHLRNLSWWRTVVYIQHEALSGAAIMALGADEIVMAPHARLGDAGPIFQGEDALFRHAPEKIRTNLVRHVRDLAQAAGRPPALAEAMVDMDLVVYRATNRETGEVTFMSDPEFQSLDDPDKWEKGPPVHESRKGLFLEVNGQRAVELGLADATAGNLQQVAARYGVPVQDIIVFSSDWVDTTVMVLNSWLVTMLLFVVGLIALYIELSSGHQHRWPDCRTVFCPVFLEPIPGRNLGLAGGRAVSAGRGLPVGRTVCPARVRLCRNYRTAADSDRHRHGHPGIHRSPQRPGTTSPAAHAPGRDRFGICGDRGDRRAQQAFRDHTVVESPGAAACLGHRSHGIRSDGIGH